MYIYILNQGFLLKFVFTYAKTIKYIAFKHALIDEQIILNPNFQIKFIKREHSILDYLTREICKVHETMAPKKNAQAPNPQKTQSSQAPSPHKMLWSQQVVKRSIILRSKMI